MAQEIALIGDLHIGARNGSEHFRQFFRTTLRKMFVACKAAGITDLYQFGDFFDSRRGITSKDISFVQYEIMEWLEELGLHMHILAGNHDLLSSEHSRHSTLHVMNRYGCVTIYKEPTEVNSPVGKILLIPWINDDNRVRASELIHSSDAKFCFGHFEIEGFRMQANGKACEHGLSPTDFKRFDAVFSGHFHHPSTLVNIGYLGTPWHLRWDDYVDDKGWYRFDGTNLELQAQDNTLFSIVKYDEDETIDLDQYTGRIIKVVCNERTDEKKWKAFKKKLEKVELIDYSIIDNTVITTEEVELSEEELAVDTVSTIRSYVEKIEGIEIEPLGDYMVEVYNRAEARNKVN